MSSVMYGYMTIHDFKATYDADHVPPTYERQQMDEAEETAKRLCEFYPAQALVKFSRHTDEKHARKEIFEHADVFLIHPLQIRVDYSKHKGKYEFYAMKMHDFRQVSLHDKNKAGEAIGTPQLIGVLTAKKVQAWVSYYEKLYDAVKIKNDEHAAVEQTFRDSLEGLPVHWYNYTSNNKKTHGSLERGGLIFEFSIEDYHINTSIKVAHGYGSDLATFLKMSCNDLATEQARNHTSGKEKINY